jgi:sugar phosphate isomerase/epimerase
MIGLGTYAFFWQQSELAAGTPAGRLDAFDMLKRTKELGVDLFQICDYPEIDAMSVEELARLADLAHELDITLELGTKGVTPEHLTRYLHLAEALDVSLIRSMLFSPTSRPTLTEAEAQLRSVLDTFDAAGVTIALETYEQVTSTDLVSLVEAVGHARLGICLDPANAVAALENPRDVIDRTAPYVKNIHVKDFAFTRRGGWVGFTLEGAPLGTGLLDYDYLVDTVRPDERGINQIVEHWLPLHDTIEETVQLENNWNEHNLRVLRAHNKE